jgi:regulator of nonsense transcripts 2
MDVEFIIQDTLALVRPEWKLAPSLEEAARAFSEAVTQNYAASNDKAVDQDSGDDSLSDNDLDASEDRKGRKTDPQSSGDEAEVGYATRKSWTCHQTDILQQTEPEQAAPQSSGESENEQEEDIVVTRKESERDPEADAEFDRELAKMMAESLDARKFERKPMFDAALPMKKHITLRESSPTREEDRRENPTPPGTMSFSLLTKRNNRQQVMTFLLLPFFMILTFDRLELSSYLQAPISLLL